jgi:hypothetical protein
VREPRELLAWPQRRESFEGLVIHVFGTGRLSDIESPDAEPERGLNEVLIRTALDVEWRT